MHVNLKDKMNLLYFCFFLLEFLLYFNIIVYKSIPSVYIYFEQRGFFSIKSNDSKLSVINWVGHFKKRPFLILLIRLFCYLDNYLG